MKEFAIKSTFFLFITATFAACTLERPSYKISSEELLHAALSADYLLSPDDAWALLEDPDYLFIDLRSPTEFALGHIDGAINIPTPYLLNPVQKSKFKDPAKEVVLYGKDQLAANGPWMLLRQLGYHNIKVLQGGYAYFSDLEAADDYAAEQARFPYDLIFAAATQRTRLEEESLRAKSIVVKQAAPKKTIVPKKKKGKEEEEEGC